MMQINRTMVSISLLILAFISCFFHTFSWLHYKYSLRDSYYSHGYLVPLISIYLIYSMRHKLMRMEFTQERYGLAIAVFALLMHIFAVMGDINFVSGFSMFFYILGGVLFLFGRKVTKEMLFPIFFLIFMLPIPDQFINYLGLPTKSFATDIGLWIIGFLKIPFFREGFRINLINTTLVVGTPCNGMKSLISFMAIGVLALYFSQVNIKKSLLIIAGVYPMSVVLNGIRIAILVYIADTYGIEKASPESFLHDLSGMVVFIIGLIILILFVNKWRKNFD